MRGTHSVLERRSARSAEIVAAAWQLAREHGIAGISLRGLASAVGMRQPSLYEYFDSKHALYDAMFADGNRQLIDRLDAVKRSADPRRDLKRLLGAFVDFATEDPARCELLFQRHVPGFVPTADSYALAQDALGRVIEAMRDAGVSDEGDVDCLVAVVAGLVEAQLANDPGGRRWLRHLDRMIDLHVNDAIQRSNP